MACMSSGHHRVTQAEFDEWDGDWAGMFRAPSARALSHYNHVASSHAAGDCEASHAGAVQMTEREYVSANAGLSVKMLSGQEDGMCGFNYCRTSDPANKTNFADPKFNCSSLGSIVPDIDLAIKRLDGFKFVGLQEEWPLSVCLFHAKLGGECFAVEDQDTHIGNYSGHEESEASASGLEIIDEYDQALYDAVQKRFRADVEKYGATNENCRVICPALAARFID